MVGHWLLVVPVGVVGRRHVGMSLGGCVASGGSRYAVSALWWWRFLF